MQVVFGIFCGNALRKRNRKNLMILKISDYDFQSKVLDNNNMVIVLFFEYWNAGSKFLEKHLTEIIIEYFPYITVCKIDAEENKKIAEKYNVMDSPTTLIFKSGELIEIIYGLYSKKMIVKVIKNNINEW